MTSYHQLHGFGSTHQAPVGILTEGYKENQETPILLYWPAIKESLASDFCSRSILYRLLWTELAAHYIS